VSCVLSAVSGQPLVEPIMLPGGGGPDAFGYRYLDSDTICPGSPTFNWVEIKGLGTEITTLGDDNDAGPFQLGFEFPYYWYRVTSCCVGSNGLMAFHEHAFEAAPFETIPSPWPPNNILAPLMCDLDCSGGGSPQGSVWYWTSADADSFIVEYDSIQFWSTGGNNTFQIILSNLDSSITFQYKEQSGAPYGGWVSNQTGIEDVSGTIGLNYLSGMFPPQNMYHDSLAVLFIPPESTTLQIHDVGTRNAMNDRNGGFFVFRDLPVRLWAVVENFGNQPELPFKVYFKVARQNNTVVFSDSMTAPAQNPGQTDSLVLPSTWRPAAYGTYALKVYTKMAGDMTVANDTATLELRVVRVRDNLAYDGGTPASYIQRHGCGNRFVPPAYPCSVSSCRVNMSAATPTDVELAIFDDYGPGGSPGDTIFAETVRVTDAGWYAVAPEHPVAFFEGAFFVCGTSVGLDTVSFGMDSIRPLSFQGWEYTGAWAPSRDMALRDVCANATVYGPVGILDETMNDERGTMNVGPTVVRGVLVLGAVDSRQNTGHRAELLDAAGRKVMALRPGANDVRALAPGVYFVRQQSVVSSQHSGPSAVGGERFAVSVRKVVVTR
jgi:hypothetical protein